MTKREASDLSRLLRGAVAVYVSDPIPAAVKALQLYARGFNYHEIGRRLRTRPENVRYYIEMWLSGSYPADGREASVRKARDNYRGYLATGKGLDLADWDRVLRGVANGFWSMSDATNLMGVTKMAVYQRARRAIIGVQLANS